jgi:CheY-like chemotaxis protein
MAKLVLIVDDEPDVVRYLSSVLESHDYEVTTADNSTDAMKAIVSHRPDLICLDIMMPEESGLSLYVKLRSRKKLRGIPVVVVSGMAPKSEFDLHDFVEDPAVDPPEEYIEKPIDVDAFVAAVNRLTSNERSNRATEAGGGKS